MIDDRQAMPANITTADNRWPVSPRSAKLMPETPRRRMSSALEALRSATADRHRSLENDSNVLPRLLSPIERPVLIAGYHSFHGAAEAALSGWLSDDGAPAGPALASRQEAIGFLYVICGARFGARIIRRELARAGIVIGTDFLTPAGCASRYEWHDVIALIEGELGHDDATLAAGIDGALKAFDCARHHLCP